MTTLQAIVLGFVQGITEFLPVSSSGHLVLIQKLWNIHGDELLFITCLHLGTLLAVTWAFRRDVADLLRHPFSPMGRMILAALVPTAVIGLLFKDAFERLFATPITVGFEFVITGIILWWMDGSHQGKQVPSKVGFRDALWIGAAQGAAILPALSRSGLTIAAALWRGIDRNTAGRFSFLLSIPAILGATLLETETLLSAPAEDIHVDWVPIGLGTLASMLAGYAAVKGTMWLLRNAKMRYFAVYVWLLAAFILTDQLFLHHWFPSLV